jgi:uroporphyrinogen III methyltransferase/synthase
MTVKGKVFITGAGPGDEKLITVKALECLKIADVVIYDYLVNESLLKNCKTDCTKVYAGKKASNHTMEQEIINESIIRFALEGKTVVRLKGGDPYVFGRGGEEVLALHEKNIPFEVIPGVTAGIAVPAYAGIPVTHRDCGSVLTFITGHESIKKPGLDINWNALSKLNGTLVFYMGITNLPNITNKLMENGLSGQTPVALIRWGTTHKQQTLCGNLSDIVSKTVEAGFKPPALIVIGNSVNYREKLKWFEQKELFGKRILVTRSRKQTSALTQQLTDLGAEVIELPTIDILPCIEYSVLDNAILNIHSYQWIVFTSVNAVNYFMNRLLDTGKDTRFLYFNKIAAIGAETVSALSSFGIKCDLIPTQYSSKVVAQAFSSYGLDKGSKILIPTSETAHETLPSALSKMGAIVDCVPAYRNVMPSYEKEYLHNLFSRPFDLVTFTSSSTVSNLAELLKTNGMITCLSQLRGVSIGPATTRTAKEFNVNIVAEADPHTIAALVKTVVSYLRN